MCIRDRIKSVDELYLTLAPGFVSDYAANDNVFEGPVAMTPPDCDCAAGSYIAARCTSRDDARCEACSSTCDAGFYEASPCGTYSDIGCEACRGCGFPYYDAGGCSGADDRVCAECTTCTDMEYESSPCEAGNDRVCVSCARDSECVNPTDNCRNVAKWWYQQNCLSLIHI